MEPRIQYAKTSDGVNIALYAMGAGPAIVCTSNVLWSDLNTQMGFREYHRSTSGVGRHNTVVRYDSRGTGLSDRGSLDFSLDARLRDLEAVIDCLRLENFILFAAGHACVAALAFTAMHPERVSHLAMVGAYAKGNDFFAYARRFQSYREIADTDWEGYTLMLASRSSRFSDSVVAQRVAVAYRKAMTPAAVNAFYESLRTIDVTEQLSQIVVPTLVIENEPVDYPLEWGRTIAAAVPGARYVLNPRPRAGYIWGDEDTRVMEAFLGNPTPETLEVKTQSAASTVGSLRTILFTDLVGHTQMMQRLGDDKGRDVLREHERITREVLRAHSGTEVKTMGDGFLASFGSVTKAVECAIALQRAFAERNAAVAEALDVRVGLNAGEPIEEDGDLFGSTVILASRIAATAGGGEILVSDVVHGLCSGKSFAFDDRGEQTLRGFEHAVRVFGISWS
jgi:class 3 adenylate cyclase